MTFTDDRIRDLGGQVPLPRDLPPVGAIVAAATRRRRRRRAVTGGAGLAAVAAAVAVGATTMGSSAARDDRTDVVEPAGEPTPVEPTPGAEVLLTVPDVVGLDGMAARRALEQAGLAVEIRDSPAPPDLLSAVVVAQSPAAGTVVPPGTVVALHFDLATEPYAAHIGDPAGSWEVYVDEHGTLCARLGNQEPGCWGRVAGSPPDTTEPRAPSVIFTDGAAGLSLVYGVLPPEVATVEVFVEGGDSVMVGDTEPRLWASLVQPGALPGEVVFRDATGADLARHPIDFPAPVG